MSKIFKFAFIGLWFLSLGFSLGEKVVDAKVNKKKVETGEIFTYEVIVRGSLESSAQLKLPEFKDFKVISQSQFQNYSMKGDQAKTTINFTYHIFASKPGVYTIEPVILENKENKYQSPAITIKVEGKPLTEKKKIQPYIDKGTNL